MDWSGFEDRAPVSQSETRSQEQGRRDAGVKAARNEKQRIQGGSRAYRHFQGATTFRRPVTASCVSEEHRWLSEERPLS